MRHNVVKDPVNGVQGAKVASETRQRSTNMSKTTSPKPRAADVARREMRREIDHARNMLASWGLGFDGKPLAFAAPEPR